MTTTETQTDFKVNDVFYFQYNEQEIKTRFEPRHCFDGQFIVKQRPNGEIYFIDTFWASKHNGFANMGDIRTKSVEDALRQGTLRFVCNLDDVEEIAEGEVKYYANEDVFDLSYQHGCYKYFVKKKGAVRSKEKMIESIKLKIEDQTSKMRWAQREIEYLKEQLLKVEAGDTTIYF